MLRFCLFKTLKESYQPIFGLFRAQCLHWINVGGARRREPHSQESHNSKDEWCRYKYRRIPGPDAEEKVG